MTEQHTPGPWHVVTDKTTRYTWLVGVADTWIPRIACIPPYAHSPVAANARLIAAAPELLQEVEWLLDAYIDAIRAYAVSFKRQPNPEDDKDVIRVRALIAKVRGTQ